MVSEYKNPPFVEALCEIHFNELGWDITHFADFYNAIKEKFPIKKAVEIQDLQVVVSNKGVGVNSNQELNKPILNCINEEGNIIVQFSENILAISIAPPYLGWGNFKDLIFELYEKYFEIVKPKSIKRVNLVYKNTLKTGEKHSYENIKKYFHLYPAMPNIKKEETNAIQLFVEIPSKDGKNVLVLQQATLKPTKEIMAPVALDLKYICLNPKGLNFDSWLEEAHDAIKLTFENSITNLSKKNFNL